MRNQGEVSVIIVFDVVAVLVETDVHGVTRFSHILEITGEATDQVHTIFSVKARVPLGGEDVPIDSVARPRDEVIEVCATVDPGLEQGAQFGPHQKIFYVLVPRDDAVSRKGYGIPTGVGNWF